MLALVAPTVWGTLVAISFNGLPTTLPQSLVLRTILPTATSLGTPPNTFDKRAFVVVRNGTVATVVLDLNILLVASDAVKLWRGMHICEEICESHERRVGQAVFRGGGCRRVYGRPEFGEDVLLEGFSGNTSNKAVKLLGLLFWAGLRF